MAEVEDKKKTEAETKVKAEAKAKAEAEKKAEAEAKRKSEIKQALIQECSPYITQGKKYSKIPAKCRIVINGKDYNMDYQNFIIGVGNGAYSDVKVTSIETDPKGNLSRIEVTAQEKIEENF